MQPPIHFLDIYPGRSCLRDFLRATSPENFLQLLADAPVGFLGLGLTGCQASERCFLSPEGLKDWRLIAVTLAPHAPAAPLTGPLGENRDKPLLNPQNTFTRDYQIPWTRLLSVWGKAVGPRLCGQNRFNMVSPESTWKDMKSSSGVCTGGFFRIPLFWNFPKPPPHADSHGCFLQWLSRCAQV